MKRRIFLKNSAALCNGGCWGSHKSLYAKPRFIEPTETQELLKTQPRPLAAAQHLSSVW